MSMIFCRGCGKQIHETAPTCPHCGSVQQLAATTLQEIGNAPIWMSITSMVLGIVVALTFFDDSGWDKNTILGVGLFACAGLVFGVISLNKKMAGRGMAITGVVLSSIGLLAVLGMLKTIN